MKLVVSILLVAAIAFAEEKPQHVEKNMKSEKRGSVKYNSDHGNGKLSPLATSSVSISFGDGKTFSHSNNHDKDGDKGLHSNEELGTYASNFGGDGSQIEATSMPQINNNNNNNNNKHNKNFNNRQGQTTTEDNIENNKMMGSYADLYGGVHADTNQGNTQINTYDGNLVSNSPVNMENGNLNLNNNQQEEVKIYLDNKSGMFNYHPQEGDSMQNYEEVKHFDSNVKVDDFNFENGNMNNNQGSRTMMDWTPMYKNSRYAGGDISMSTPIDNSYFSSPFKSEHIMETPMVKPPKKEKIESITIQKEVKYPVSKPYRVAVIKHVGYPVYHPVPYHVDKPYPVYIAKPFHFPVYKHVPYTVVKHVPYKVHIPIKVPVFQHYPVHIDKPVPYHVPFEVKVPVPHHYVVHKQVPVFIKGHQEIHRIKVSS